MGWRNILQSKEVSFITPDIIVCALSWLFSSFKIVSPWGWTFLLVNWSYKTCSRSRYILTFFYSFASCLPILALLFCTLLTNSTAELKLKLKLNFTWLWPSNPFNSALMSYTPAPAMNNCRRRSSHDRRSSGGRGEGRGRRIYREVQKQVAQDKKEFD